MKHNNVLTNKLDREYEKEKKKKNQKKKFSIILCKTVLGVSSFHSLFSKSVFTIITLSSFRLYHKHDSWLGERMDNKNPKTLP